MIARYPVTDREAWLALRAEDITASDMGALFGAHPYKTALEVYAEKIGADVQQPDSSVMRRGRILEDAVAKAVQEEKPAWVIEKATEYLRDADARVGATPDYWIADGPRKGVLQAKTVMPDVFRKYWGEVPPLYVVLQNATEMMLSGLEWGVIAALVIDPYRLELHIYDVPRDVAVEAKIKSAVRGFWINTEAGVQPTADYERDGAVLSMLYPNEVAGKSVDLRSDNMLPGLLDERDGLNAVIKTASERKSTIDAEIRAKLTDAELATLDNWKISLKTRAGYTATVKPTRVLKVTRLKHQQEAAA